MSARGVSANERVQAALAYAELGWPVFPVYEVEDRGCCGCDSKDCGSPGKHPRTRRGFKDATTYSEKIRRWWNEWPKANVGVRTGRESGLVVLDIDPRHGGDGSLVMLESKLGFPLETAESITGGGGLHMVFAHPGDRKIRNATSLGGYSGLDLRGDSGYFVAPPSNHESGDLYRWGEGHVPAVEDLAPLPPAIVGLLDKGHPTPTAPPLGDGRISEGERNSTLASLAGTMTRRRMTPSTIEAALLSENRDRCTRPLPDEEVRRIARSIGRYPPALDAECDGVRNPEDDTDAGRASRFLRVHKGDVLYVPARKRWYLWDATRFRADYAEGTGARELAKRAMETIGEDNGELDREQAEDRRKEYRTARSMRATRDLLSMAESEVSTDMEALDSDPYLLNVRNGTLDLRTGEMREHRQSDLLTRVAPVAYDPEAKCPEWDRFMNRVQPDAKMREYLKRMAGTALVGEAHEVPMLVYLGRGANGKSVFVETVRAVLGSDYSAELASHALTTRSRTGDELERTLVPIVGKRLLTALELHGGQKLHEQAVKRLVSGEPVRVRYLYAESFEATPGATIWITSNHQLEIAGTDDGIWRRLREVPFSVQIPEDERDPELRAKLLREEAPGILRWMVEGCLAWQAEGLDEPDVVRAATSAYRDEQDDIGAFVAECCEVGDALWVPNAQLRPAYEAWAKRQGVDPLNSTAFAGRLKQQGFTPKRSGSGARGWRRLGLPVMNDDWMNED